MTDNKKQLAQYFMSDAKDFILRYKTLKESSTSFGLKTKLIVDLMFALECALKSLYIIETDLSEKNAYKNIREFSHNISKIIENLKPESKTVFLKIVPVDYQFYKVYQRYIFESEMAFREELGNMGLIYYERINNPNWRQSFRDQIVSFIEFVESKIPIEFKTISFAEIDIHEEINKFKKLKEILE